MAVGTVRTTGLRETIRAFNNLERTVSREIQAELKQAAEPVVATARDAISRYQGARVTSIVPRAAGASVFVTQKARKVTGKRGDFGRLQQRHLERALEDNQEAVVREVEQVLDRLVSREGFGRGGIL